MKTTVTVTKTITVTSTTKWLDQAKEKLALSDYSLAPLLGVTRSQMSRYRNGHDFLSDDAAIKLAALLGLDDAAPVIASAHAERSKSAEARAFWERLASVAAGLCMAVGVVSAPSPAEARTASLSPVSGGSSLYIMLSLRTVDDGPGTCCLVPVPWATLTGQTPASGEQALHCPAPTIHRLLTTIWPASRLVAERRT